MDNNQKTNLVHRLNVIKEKNSENMSNRLFIMNRIKGYFEHQIDSLKFQFSTVNPDYVMDFIPSQGLIVKNKTTQKLVFNLLFHFKEQEDNMYEFSLSTYFSGGFFDIDGNVWDFNDQELEKREKERVNRDMILGIVLEKKENTTILENEKEDEPLIEVDNQALILKTIEEVENMICLIYSRSIKDNLSVYIK